VGCGTHEGEEKYAQHFLWLEKTEGKEQCGKSRRRRDYNIKVDLLISTLLDAQIYRKSIVKATEICSYL